MTRCAIALQRTRGLRFCYTLDALSPAPLSAAAIRSVAHEDE